MEEDQGLIDLVLKVIKEKLTPQGNMEIGKINKSINYKMQTNPTFRKDLHFIYIVEYVLVHCIFTEMYICEKD